MNAKPYSDLDLAVQANQPVYHQELTRVAMEFEESDLPWSVDILDLQQTSTALKEAIANDLVLIRRPVNSAIPQTAKPLAP